MPRIKDITGNKYQRLFVIGDSGVRDKARAVKWACLCDCGNIVFVSGHTLKSGKQQSCGCIIKERIPTIMHGHTVNNTSTPTYKSWASMIQRCTNIKNPKYNIYGKRGIIVCERWLHSFENFLEDMGTKPEGLTLERIDTNGNYEPLNCKWASHKEQANNKRNTTIIEFKEKQMTVSQWADHIGISFSTLRMRLYRGWEIERALTK